MRFCAISDDSLKVYGPDAGDDSLEPSRALPAARALVHSHELDPVSGLAAVHQVVRQNNLHASGQLARRRPFRHLLDVDRLVVPERREAVLHQQRVPLAVVLRDDGGGSGELGRGGDDRRVVI